MGSSTKQIGEAMLTSPEAAGFTNQLLGGLTPQAQSAYGEFLQPYDPEQFQGLFQQAFVDPAMQAFEQQFVPSLQQQFIGANAGSSSALNQALAAAAGNLSTNIGQQAGQFYQGQQQNKLSAVQGLNQLAGQRTLDPIIQQGYNPWGDIIAATGQIGAGTAQAISSIEYKENIRDYNGGLEKIKSMSVKQYDYKEQYASGKDCVGLIAEEVPEEIYVDSDGKIGVDVYGLCSMLVDAVQNLTEKVEKMEASHANFS